MQETLAHFHCCTSDLSFKMKFIVALSVLAGALVDAAALTAEVCPSKYQSKLAGCSTGKDFCTSLLGYSAGSSQTLTVSTQTTSTFTYTKTKYIASSTSFVTTTLYGVTAHSTLTTTTSVPTQTLTV